METRDDRYMSRGTYVEGLNANFPGIIMFGLFLCCETVTIKEVPVEGGGYTIHVVDREVDKPIK